MLETIVEPGPYKGIVGTLWSIVRVEGASQPQSHTSTLPGRDRDRHSRAAGVAGLFRGWKVGMWGLVGVWGASALGSGSGASEF